MTLGWDARYCSITTPQAGRLNDKIVSCVGLLGVAVLRMSFTKIDIVAALCSGSLLHICYG